MEDIALLFIWLFISFGVGYMWASIDNKKLKGGDNHNGRTGTNDKC